MNAYVYLIADLVAITILVGAIYLPRHRRGDLALAYTIINLGVAAVSCVLSLSTASAGLGLGLFGVLAIIRLRSEELTQTEVGYYFAALVLGLIGGMGASISSPLPLILMAVIVLVTAVLDTRLLNNDTEYVNITVDRAFTDTDELSEYLAVQFNVEVVSVRIARVDVLKDCTVVDAKLRRANRHRTRPEIENAAITGAPETGAPNTAISWSN